MRRTLPLILLLALATCGPVLRAQVDASWITPRPPFRIADNLFYVGGADLAAYVVTTPAGNILINANYTGSPAQIRKSVEELGLRWQDTKILLDSQAHADHMGGAAEILRETGARNMVMAGDDEVVRSGGVTDFAFGPKPQFPPARVDRVLHDGDAVSLGNPKHGGVVLTAHKTAGHTRGCTTWTLRVHLPGEPAEQLRDVVIVGGFDPLPSYRLTGDPHAKGAYPGIADDFRHTYATLRALPCDIFLGAHGQYFGMEEKLARMPQQGASVWLDRAGYEAAVHKHQQAFEADLARQTVTQAPMRSR